MATNIAKFLVYATAVVFFFYGFLFAIFPAEMSVWATGASPSTPSGMIDLRATYGGAQMAIGAVMLYLVAVKKELDTGLVMVAFVLLLMAVSRTLGILTDGAPNILMYVFLSTEVGFGMLALIVRQKISD